MYAHVHDASARDVFNCDQISKVFDDSSFQKSIGIVPLQLSIRSEGQDCTSRKGAASWGRAHRCRQQASRLPETISQHYSQSNWRGHGTNHHRQGTLDLLHTFEDPLERLQCIVRGSHFKMLAMTELFVFFLKELLLLDSSKTLEEWSSGTSSWRMFTVFRIDLRMTKVLADGDVKLAESNVVSEYLDAAYPEAGTKLFPADPVKLAKVLTKAQTILRIFLMSNLDIYHIWWVSFQEICTFMQAKDSQSHADHHFYSKLQTLQLSSRCALCFCCGSDKKALIQQSISIHRKILRRAWRHRWGCLWRHSTLWSSQSASRSWRQTLTRLWKRNRMLTRMDCW